VQYYMTIAAEPWVWKRAKESDPLCPLPPSGTRSVEKRQQGRREGRRVLLGDPVSRVRYADRRDILGDLAHHLVEEIARVANHATDGEDRYRQIPAARQCGTVVLRVPIERAIGL